MVKSIRRAVRLPTKPLPAEVRRRRTKEGTPHPKGRGYTYILVINAGSSSLKFELFDYKTLASVLEGVIDSITPRDHQKLISQVIKALIATNVIRGARDIKTVGHRVVHGGEKYTKPTVITPTVIRTIRKIADIAPLHNPANLEGILACKKILPHAKQIAVFDTAFHQTMPEKAFLYAIPNALYKKYGIRRFGFHGTSHYYVYEQARKKLGVEVTRRTVTCHLGNGCSITAIKNGKSIDTSMGFTPLSGVPMGTRSGDIDPAIIFHLIRKGWEKEAVEYLLEKKSGLLAMSGISSDMRLVWHAAKKGNKKAQKAIERFAYRIAQYIGAYAAALGGIDCLVFTGGIGEHAAYVRKPIVTQLKYLRIKHILVVPTDEEKAIAEAVKQLSTR